MYWLMISPAGSLHNVGLVSEFMSSHSLVRVLPAPPQPPVCSQRPVTCPSPRLTSTCTSRTPRTPTARESTRTCTPSLTSTGTVPASRTRQKASGSSILRGRARVCMWEQGMRGRNTGRARGIALQVSGFPTSVHLVIQEAVLFLLVRYRLILVWDV